MKILVPIDGSKSSKHCLVAAEDFGRRIEADLLVLTVIPDTSIFEQYPTNFAYTMEVDRANAERAEYVLKEAENELANYPYSVETFYTSGNPSQEICKFAQEHDVNLIVMGNRGLGKFSRTLLGSTSNKVLNQSSVSVLIVKGDI